MSFLLSVYRGVFRKTYQNDTFVLFLHVCFLNRLYWLLFYVSRTLSSLEVWDGFSVWTYSIYEAFEKGYHALRGRQVTFGTTNVHRRYCTVYCVIILLNVFHDLKMYGLKFYIFKFINEVKLISTKCLTRLLKFKIRWDIC